MNCNCGRFPERHEKTRLCNLGYNEFLGEVQHRLIQAGYNPPIWPEPSIRDQGDIDAALDSCVKWCKDRLDERARPEASDTVPMSYRAFSSAEAFRSYCEAKARNGKLAWDWAYELWLREVGRSLPQVEKP